MFDCNHNFFFNCVFLFVYNYLFTYSYMIAQLAGAVEYSDCISVEE